MLSSNSVALSEKQGQETVLKLGFVKLLVITGVLAIIIPK